VRDEQAAEILRHSGGGICCTLPVNDMLTFKRFIYQNFSLSCMQGSYHVGNTASRPISEVKQRWALLVLAWETSLEPSVTLRFFGLRSVAFSFFDGQVVDKICPKETKRIGKK
jgi:hypothetical protein